MSFEPNTSPHTGREQEAAMYKQGSDPKSDQKDVFSSLYTIYNEFKKNTGPKFVPLKTGFEDLDAILGGGLTPGLIILGGMPGIGKSTLALQIAVNVAESGNPVLYFSLEMPENRLMAKAITRKIYEIKKRSLYFTADDLLQGPLPENQQEKVDAMMQNRDQFPGSLYVCTKPLTASEILEESRAFEAREKTTPLVVIDYLQLLPRHRIHQGDNDDKSDKNDGSDKSDKQIVDSNIYKLMNLAHGVKKKDSPVIPGVPVILLSSLNRTAYSTGRSYGSSAASSIQISSFKETGGIEYTADLLLGLQLRAVGMKGFDPLSELSKNPRNVELVVLKNRYGRSGDKVRLRYDSEHDCFFPPDGEEEAEDNTPDTPDTPDTQPADQAAGSQKPQKDGIKAILNSTKVADEIRKGKSAGKCRILTDRDTGKTIYTSYSLSSPLSSLDLCVADAVYTLDHLHKKISLRAILQVLQGIKDVNLTSEKKALLNASIERLRATELELDCEDHLAQINGPAAGWSYKKGPFLRLDGPDSRGIYRRPDPMDDKAGILPLCTYAAAVNHIYTVPSRLLDIKADQDRRLSFTQDNICLKWALICRLESIRSMSRSKRYNPASKRIISFDPNDPKKNILAEVRPAKNLSGQAGAQRTGRLRTAAEIILNYYKSINYLSKVDLIPNGEAKFKDFNVSGKVKDPFKLNQKI